MTIQIAPSILSADFAALGEAIRVAEAGGVNGIDGQVSAALGAAAALGRPTVLWCGDLPLLHDVS